MTPNRRDASVLAAHQHRSGTVFMGIVVLIGAAVWAAQHALALSQVKDHTGSRMLAVWVSLFTLLMIQTFLYHLERPRRLTPRAARQLKELHVSILVPVFNEDPGYLRLGLQSFLHQTRLPDSVHVVDDGSTSTDYAELRDWWCLEAHRLGIETTWQRVPNGGKRHAQANGVRVSPYADIYVTVDSDSCLAPNALEQLITPFTRRKVQAVAGIVLATNNRGPQRPQLRRPDGARMPWPSRATKLAGWRGQQCFARVTDLWLVTSQLVDRSGQSALGSVLVNSGPLAAYRADVVRDNLESYLNETFMGRPVMLSDDSMLTLYAALRGPTVQQPSAVVFTAMPEKWSHFSRMYLRWMRGSTIRSIWRMRYLPLHRPAYWLHLLRWFEMILGQLVLAWLLIVEPLRYHNAPTLAMLAIPFLIGWAQGLRYLGVIRSDERIRSRAVTWLMTPIAILMGWTVLRVLHWYGMATCAKTGWGTRQNGAEVSLEPSSA
ncbi:glycosyltransferase family 2 protein [Streptomyces sp. RB17]|uniref:glycosyltransferase family 2 protein n=1 Tax=Streptomyces sp. RB17 TaxID=2585197 RepID=UPI002B1F2C21|nr:glycosyltransferase family 2 protein [Streptomyces sp. RB17]